MFDRYGYKNAYTTLDVLAWNSAYVLPLVSVLTLFKRAIRVWPFHKLTDAERIVTRVEFPLFSPTKSLRIYAIGSRLLQDTNIGDICVP